jgi:hypothetical protein
MCKEYTKHKRDELFNKVITSFKLKSTNDNVTTFTRTDAQSALGVINEMTPDIVHHFPATNTLKCRQGLCNVALVAFIHFKSPCQHLWAVNHWAKASHMGVTILSIYTFLNGQGWLANDLVRFSWGFAWLGIVLLFLIGHLCHRRKVPVHPETIA